jgi:catechol 2,3-dioxygenase-like lactoylglutathione lyase family enzyme
VPFHPSGKLVATYEIGDYARSDVFLSTKASETTMKTRLGKLLLQQSVSRLVARYLPGAPGAKPRALRRVHAAAGVKRRAMSGRAVSAIAVAVLASPSVDAELSNREARVIVGHYHLNVTSIEAHKKFWVDTLGGTFIELGRSGLDVIEFPDVYVFLREQPPTGPTRGTSFDHIGFAVPDVPAAAARAVANGYELTVGREPGPGETASPPTAGNYGRFAYLVGPDGVKVELVTNEDSDAPPIKHHHVHFVNKQFVEMQRWYMKAFDATLRPGETDYFIGADLPGVGYMLNFFSWLPEEDLVPTLGRVVDHVGFEVRDLERFCEELEAKGIELTEPYHIDDEHGGIAVASITDPYGVSIKLTEGLRKTN